MEEKKHTSSKISDLVRYISFGLVAITYALFTSTAAFAEDLLEQYKTLMLWASFFGGITIAFDYLQFLCGYLSTNKALIRSDNPNTYDDKWITYKARKWFFWMKQATVSVGLALFCYSMIASALIF